VTQLVEGTDNKLTEMLLSRLPTTEIVRLHRKLHRGYFNSEQQGSTNSSIHFEKFHHKTPTN